MKDTDQSKKWTAGIVAGLVNTVVFNPYDKALYHHTTTLTNSTKPRTSFWNRANWRSPYAGVSQAALHRVVSYGLYFPMWDFWTQKCRYVLEHNPRLRMCSSENTGQKSKDRYETRITFLAGSLTGTCTALMVNPLNVVKFHRWNNECSSLWQQTLLLYKRCGPRVFTKGLGYTIARDNVFAIGYGYLTNKYNPQKNFLYDLACASVCVVAASPLNYARSEVLRRLTNPETISLRTIVGDLRTQIHAVQGGHQIGDRLQNSTPSLRSGRVLAPTREFGNGGKWGFVAFQKFGVGYGTLRVGLGMAVSRQIYEQVVNLKM